MPPRAAPRIPPRSPAFATCHLAPVTYHQRRRTPFRSKVPNVPAGSTQAPLAMHIGPYPIEMPYLLAPMASVSEMPFRVLALELGAGLATTELISSSGIFYKNRRTRQYMTFDREREKPYSLQLFGGKHDVMAHAARG